MAKYKDYPIYTYDEPATYSDFSGGINTDPSNEHLLQNEMRDCLNMHFKSAALVKRKGASLLCNIECEDELYNVQGVFLFTYRITYIIIAADGKLYKGFYSPKATIRLSRLPINIDIPESLDAYNPLDITVGLDNKISEHINQKHDGFVYSYIIDKDTNKVSLEGDIYLKDINGNLILDNNNSPIKQGDLFIGDYKDLKNSPILEGQIVKYNGTYYRLNWLNKSTLPENRYIQRRLITPLDTNYWMSLDTYNETFKENIANRTDILSTSYTSLTNPNTGIVLDTKTNTWRQSGSYIENTWITNGAPGSWSERYNPWLYSSVVMYENKIYICMIQHTNYINSPDTLIANADSEWEPLFEKRELLFQNHDNIEAATYDNKMYIATGTRFVVVELLTNNLIASVVTPYTCNTTEIINIGYNYLSPYPELCRATQYNQAITSIGGVLAIKNIYGRYTLIPQMNFAQGETEKDYYFKWEKKIGDEWVTLYSYKNNVYTSHQLDYIADPEGSYILKDNVYIPISEELKGFLNVRYKQIIDTDGNPYYILDESGDYVGLFDANKQEIIYYKLAFITQALDSVDITTQRYKQIKGNKITTKLDLFTIEVDDADKYQYRVSFAKSFEQPSEVTKDWDFFTDLYKVGDKVSVKNELGIVEIYKCIQEHTPRKVLWDNCTYEVTNYYKDTKGYYSKDYVIDTLGNYVTTTANPIFSPSTSTRTGRSLYEYIGEDNYKFICYDTSTIIKGTVYWEKEFTEEAILTETGVAYDWIVNEVDGEYFGQGASILAINLEPEDRFNVIHSCKKITSDGNKFLLYDDRYNTGSWYKTIINNPAYITDRGGLSFKTNKNESLIKVVSFNGNLIAFANADNVGGSIHMITGNGDDWDDKSGYYSPYRRSTINATVSCDNANTVQVCENILVFKYFDTLYYISGSELNNEVVSVYSCNDRIKHNNNFVRIPWDDNSCISEVTEDYYALIWKEKYSIQDDDLVLERPALKVKMYYKLGTQQNEKIVYPWLRDESDYFNIDHILYIKGKPIYLYNNTLTTFHNEVYTDYDKIYTCQVHFRGEDLNYPKMIKLLSNILVYYHRNQYSKIDFDLKVKNEAGHILLDSSRKRSSLQDLRALRAGDTLVDGEVRLDSTILDSKVFNCAYKFPCLLADSTITATNDKEFSISSITYNYLTAETPDQTQYDLYTNILRPQDTYVSIQEALNTSVLETQVSKPEEVGRAIETTKVIKKEDGSHEIEVGININERRDKISVKLSETDYVENLENNLDTANAEMDDITAFLNKINSGEGYDE